MCESLLSKVLYYNEKIKIICVTQLRLNFLNLKFNA